MIKKSVRIFCPALFLIIVLAVPASAMIPSFTYLGTVTDLDPATQNITIEATHKWGCVYDDGSVTCGWMEIESQEMVSAVPVAEVYAMIAVGDTVEVTGLPDYRWNGIGLLSEDPVHGYLATDLFGDLNYLPAPLVGGYDITATTSPDCDSCTPAVCTAEYAEVTISRDGLDRWTGALFPGEKHMYYDPRDLSNVYVRFISGQTRASMCPDVDFIFDGPQPVNRFFVHANPPLIPPATTGSVIVTSRPEGATVYLDGQFLGITPVIESGIEPGVHAILVEKDGYEPWDSGVTVRVGRSSSVSARLVPLFGVIDVRSVPSGASILLDGTFAGSTNALIDGVIPGTHVVTITKEGYNPADVTAYVSAGGRTLVYKRLAPGGAVAAM
ncbi:MAG: PEGA domain-containing protein [Deltaproteobacteria bacterium]|nr:PEGA domain-containing protein [Deltaproteobacteria bacterium]